MNHGHPGLEFDERLLYRSRPVGPQGLKIAPDRPKEGSLLSARTSVAARPQLVKMRIVPLPNFIQCRKLDGERQHHGRPICAVANFVFLTNNLGHLKQSRMDTQIPESRV